MEDKQKNPSLEYENLQFSKHSPHEDPAQEVDLSKNSGTSRGLAKKLVSSKLISSQLTSSNTIESSGLPQADGRIELQLKDSQRTTESQSKKEIKKEIENSKIAAKSAELSLPARDTVSEEAEGKNWFRWCMGISVLLSAVVAVCGYFLVAVGILVLADLVATTWRLVARKSSPWKVRSVKFDCIVGYLLAILLTAMCVSLYFF